MQPNGDSDPRFSVCEEEVDAHFQAGLGFPSQFKALLSIKNHDDESDNIMKVHQITCAMSSRSWVWATIMMVAAGLSQIGCGAKSTEEEDSGGAAVGGTMQIAVPSSFQLAVVVFKSEDGSTLGRVEPVTESTFEYTRGDGSVVQLNLEKRQLVAQDSEGASLFAIAREGDLIGLTAEGEEEPAWSVKYAGTDVEIYQASEEPVAILRWVQDESEYLKDEVHLIDAGGEAKYVTYLENGSTLIRDAAGKVLFSAEGFEDRRTMSCLSIEGMPLDQQIALAVFLASQ